MLVFDLGLVDGALAVTASTDVSGPLYGTVDMPDWANTHDEIAVYVDNADNADDLWIIPVDNPCSVKAQSTADLSSAVLQLSAGFCSQKFCQQDGNHL